MSERDDFEAWLAGWLAGDGASYAGMAARLHAAMRAGFRPIAAWISGPREDLSDYLDNAEAAFYRAVRASLEGEK